MASFGDSWIQEYNEAGKLADDISNMISERNSLPATGPEAQRHSSSIRRKITILGTRLDSLQSIDSKLPGKQRLTAKEMNRRKDMLANLKSKATQMASTLNMSNFANRDSLLGPETKAADAMSRTTGLDNYGVVGLQRQIMKEQDEGLDKLEETVMSSKHIALAVNEELDLQTRLIDTLDEHVDVTDSRLQIISPEEPIQKEQPMDKILSLLTTLCTKVDSMDKEIQLLKQSSQQHDVKYAELRRSKDVKIPDLEGDVEKLPKTQTNEIVIAATEQSSTSTGKLVNQAIIGLQHKSHKGMKAVANPPTKTKNTNLNTLFAKPYTPNLPKVQTVVTPQTVTYSESLNQNKNTYTHITRTYIDNLYKLQSFLNQKPRSTTTTDPEKDYITQHNQRHNKLIALPGTNPNLVHTCYNYGLLSTVYTIDGTEISTIPELYKAFSTYKRITKGTLFYIKCYSAPAEISLRR